MTSKRPNIRQIAAYRQAQREIRDDVARGVVPKSVSTFAELHDYVDANEYGGFTAGEDGSWPFDGTDNDGSTYGWKDETVAEMNDVQNALNDWLKRRPFEWTTGLVDLGGIGGPYLAVWQDDDRWNGWLACPWFDAHTAVAILNMVNEDGQSETVDGEEVENYYGYDWHFEDDGTLVVVSRQDRFEDPEHFYTERITPNDDGLYSVGSWGWVWSEASWIEHLNVEHVETIDPVVLAALPIGDDEEEHAHRALLGECEVCERLPKPIEVEGTPEHAAAYGEDEAESRDERPWGDL